MGIGLFSPSTVSGKDIGCCIISFFVKQEQYNNVRVSIWDNRQIEGVLKCSIQYGLRVYQNKDIERIPLLLGGGEFSYFCILTHPSVLNFILAYPPARSDGVAGHCKVSLLFYMFDKTIDVFYKKPCCSILCKGCTVSFPETVRFKVTAGPQIQGFVW